MNYTECSSISLVVLQTFTNTNNHAPAFIYAIIIGGATNIIMRMGAQQARFLYQLKQLHDFIDNNKFPLELKNRMEDFFYYNWYNNKGIDQSTMMEAWPRNLKEDTSLFLHRFLFMQWPVFNLASTGCRRALSSLVRRYGNISPFLCYHYVHCLQTIIIPN